jgi:ATP-binding cassette subfamily F protein 3
MLLEISNVTKFWGADLLFQDVNGYIDDQQVIGFIGNNGAGKSTLCNLIAGLDTEYDGTIKKYPQVRIAYFKQMMDSDLEGDTSVFDYVLKTQQRVLDTETEYHTMLNRLQTEEVTAALLSEFGEIQEAYELSSAVDLVERIEGVLNGLGIFETLDLTIEGRRNITYYSKIKELSGGERKIVELAVVLLNKAANVLILDEPTNHLDMEARAWLESFIKGFRGSVIVVSHDRHLLNSVSDQIWEVADFTMTTYKGNFDTFERVKRERLEALRHSFEMQKKEKERLEAIITAYRTNQRQGGNYVTVKLYNATKSRLERFIDNMAPEPPKDRPELRLSLENTQPKGYTVVRLQDFSFSYDKERYLLKNQELTLTKENKIALLGANGAGKSTFMKLILAKYCLLHGLDPHNYGIADFIKNHKEDISNDKAFYLGPGIKIGYYSQHHNQLNNSQTIRELLWQNEIKDESQFQSIIRRYHFQKETVDHKKVKDLSGGEKSKLQFLLLMLSGANTLLLDEPINHLDIASMKVVEQVLHDFTGALMVISHDRYFLSRVVNKIVYFKNQKLHEFRGTIDEYVKK